MPSEAFALLASVVADAGLHTATILALLRAGTVLVHLYHCTFLNSLLVIVSLLLVDILDSSGLFE